MTNSKSSRQILITAVLAIALAFPITVFADIAPPANPPGSNLGPGNESTQVRMIAETVLIDVQKDERPNSLGQAYINAGFTMRNTSPHPESMAVRFPLGADNNFDRVPEIKGILAKVNGRVVGTHRTVGPDPRREGKEAPWAEFNVTFPPAQEVQINVSYNLIGSGYYPDVFYEYFLSTGAGWKDSIGSADIILRLPYEANALNVIFGGALVMGMTPENGIISGNEIRWHYDDLEPTEANNLHFDLIAPSAWNKVLNERRNVESNPNDGEAWGRLGKIYKEIAFLSKGDVDTGGPRDDPGGTQLYNLSLQAYEKAVALLPKDALWRAGFAELLWLHCCYRTSVDATTHQSELLHVLNELRLSVAIDPKNIKANELLDWISSSDPDYVAKQGNDYVFLALTATPTTIMKPTVTIQPPTPTHTPQPTASSAAKPPPKTAPAFPICSTALIPLLVVLWFSKNAFLQKR